MSKEYLQGLWQSREKVSMNTIMSNRRCSQSDGGFQEKEVDVQGWNKMDRTIGAWSSSGATAKIATTDPGTSSAA